MTDPQSIYNPYTVVACLRGLVQKRFQWILRVVEKGRQKYIWWYFIDNISEEHFFQQTGPIRRDSDQMWNNLEPDTPEPGKRFVK